MGYALFIGCVTPILAQQNEVATRRVAKELGIELIDVLDFACCGFPIKSINVKTARLLAARNLSVAEERGLNICTICTGCTSNLQEANKEIQENPRFKTEVNRQLHAIDREYTGRVTVKHFARVLYEDLGVDKLKRTVTRSLDTLAVAPHYGCHYLKPTHVHGSVEDPEFPRSLDELITLTGARAIDYDEKTQCCGGNLLGVDERTALTIASKKLDHARAAAADAFTLVCPLCNVMFDRNQRSIEKRQNRRYELPVLFYPQLLGLALGINPAELGCEVNRTPVASIVNRI